jgi:magnesium transporter
MATTLTPGNLDDPVTKHMRGDCTRLPVGLTVGQALDWLRDHPPAGRIIYFYVVDEEERLQGVVPTRRLLLSLAGRPLADVMIRRVITLPAAATVLEACELFIQHRLLAFPVVDDDRRLLGVVDVELYTDEVSSLGAAGQADDLFQTIGVRLADARQPSPLPAFRKRFPWLGCNIAAGILAAFLAGLYHDALDRVVALAFFIPVVLNLAESVSSQSVSLALQLLHGPAPTGGALLQKLRAEALTGLLLGLGSGAIIALVGLVGLGASRLLPLGQCAWVALCLLLAIAGGVAGAAVLGVALPVLLRLLRLEPRVAAGPLALAGADVITILLYLNLARWLLT